MKSTTIENIIIVKSKTRLQQLTEKFNTQAQAKFYINQSKEQFYTKQKAVKKNMAVRKNTQFNTKNPALEVLEQQQVIDELQFIENDITTSAEQEELTLNEAVEEEVSEEHEETETADSSEDENKKDVGDFSDYEKEHEHFMHILNRVRNIASKYLKTKVIEREFLANYIFTEKDLIIVVGQDGLVANTAKYVNNIPIIAINPDSERFDGVLLPFVADELDLAINVVLSGNYRSIHITMAEVKLNDGQRLLAFNDLFIGPNRHTSARYRITFNGKSENHSSSGVIVSTGAGSTGWLSSLFNMARGINRFAGGREFIEVKPLPKDTDEIIFIVREPFLSKISQIGITAGKIGRNNELILESQMPRGGVIFSDGIMTDYLDFNSGAIATIRIAKEKAVLVLK